MASSAHGGNIDPHCLDRRVAAALLQILKVAGESHAKQGATVLTAQGETVYRLGEIAQRAPGQEQTVIV